MTRRLPVAVATLLLAGGLAGCGGDGQAPPGPGTTTARTVAVDDVGSLGVDDALESAGSVTLCGAAADVAAAAPGVRRFNVDRPRFQASTIAFPGAARAARELEARARASSSECDVYLVADAAVPELAGRGWLANLQPYTEERAKDAPFAAVRAGVDAFGAPLAGAGPRGPALVVATASKSPGPALALLDALSGGTTTQPEP